MPSFGFILLFQIYFFQNAEGTGLSPFDSWLLLRGVKTMHIRVEKQQENAIRVARFLKAHPCTTHVSGLCFVVGISITLFSLFSPFSPFSFTQHSS